VKNNKKKNGGGKKDISDEITQAENKKDKNK